MKRDERRETAQTVDAWWDDFVESRRTSGNGKEPEMASTIRVIHRVSGTPEMRPTFADQLEQRLDRLARERAPRRTVRKLGMPALPTWGSPALLVLAVMALVGGFFSANVPGPSGDDSGPLRLAAPQSTPGSTPVTGDIPISSSEDVSVSGQAPGPAPVGMPDIAWELPFEDRYVDDIKILGDRLFIGSYSGFDRAWILECYSLDGKSIWSSRVPAGGYGLGSIAIDQEHVYLATQAGISALDGMTGVIDWEVGWQIGWADGYASLNKIVANRGMVYAIDGRTEVVALNAIDGSKIWEQPLSETENEITGLFSVKNGVVLIRSTDGTMKGLDGSNGQVIWQANAADESLIMEGDLVIYTAPPLGRETGERSIVILNARTGAPVRTAIPTRKNVQLAARGNLLVASGGSATDAIDLSSGEILWSRNDPGESLRPIIVGNELFIFNPQKGTVTGLDLGDGSEIWSVYLGPVSIATIVDYKVIVKDWSKVTAVTGNQQEAYAGTTTDLSGLPQCVLPRSIPSAELEGTPTATLVAQTPDRAFVTQDVGFRNINQPVRLQWTLISPDEVPPGTALSPEEMVGIQDTFRMMNNCLARPEAADGIVSFFSDDFYRRGQVPFRDGSYQFAWPNGPDETTIGTLSPVKLDDGRIAVRIPDYEGWDYLLVLAEQNGSWLIDEVLAVRH